MSKKAARLKQMVTTWPFKGVELPAKPTQKEMSYYKALFTEGNCGLVPTAKYGYDQILPYTGVPEVAFAGRSNVGKSSLINSLLNLKGKNGLATVGKRPGVTQKINMFNLNETLMLADTPGYGFAIAPQKQVDEWCAITGTYFRERDWSELKRIFLLIDSRRGIMRTDTEFMDFMSSFGITYHFVLTKADQVSPSALETTVAQLQEVAMEPRNLVAYPSINVVSAKENVGIKELRFAVCQAAEIKLPEKIKRTTPAPY